MTFTIPEILPFVILLCLAAGAIGYGFGLMSKNVADYYRGRRDGRMEEQTYRNRILIPLRMEQVRAELAQSRN